MKEGQPIPEQKENKSFFTVYCEDEGRFIYESSGINKHIEGIIARQTAFEHSKQLGHKVYVFETGKLKFPNDD